MRTWNLRHLSQFCEPVLPLAGVYCEPRKQRHNWFFRGLRQWRRITYVGYYRVGRGRVLRRAVAAPRSVWTVRWLPGWGPCRLAADRARCIARFAAIAPATV